MGGLYKPTDKAVQDILFPGPLILPEVVVEQMVNYSALTMRHTPDSHPMNMNQAAAKPDDSEIRQRLRQFAAEFDRRFADYLAPCEEVPPVLSQAVRYSALAPGKRLRPYLLCTSCELCGGRIDDAWPVAAAVECAHVFSLIHDDLPAMDNDEFRRGQPTCHVKFGEALAILAGDALVILAFELIARHVADHARATSMVLELARGIGWVGMVGGQAADILGQEKVPDRALTEYIHDCKTGMLFSTACRLGALIAGADRQTLEALGRYGQSLGRSFQITDDLLDVTSAAEVLGKNVGKDAAARKQTMPRCVGSESSRVLARQAVDNAIAALNSLGSGAQVLSEIAEYVVARNY